MKNVHIIKITASITTKFLHSDTDHQIPFVGGPNTQIHDCGRSPSWKNRKIAIISAAFRAISIKFGTMTQFDSLHCSDRQQFEISKIQDGGSCHYEKSKNRDISATF